jgi:HK97 gp10 family phage protein
MTAISLEQLEQICRIAGQDIDKITAPIIRKTAAKVRETQKANVPVRSGRTRDSITASGPDGAPFTPTTTVAEIGPTWWVGRLIEQGTSRQPPRPFVRPSIDPHLDAHEAEVLEAVMRKSLKGLT